MQNYGAVQNKLSPQVRWTLDGSTMWKIHAEHSSHGFLSESNAKENVHKAQEVVTVAAYIYDTIITECPLRERIQWLWPTV